MFVASFPAFPINPLCPAAGISTIRRVVWRAPCAIGQGVSGMSIDQLLAAADEVLEQGEALLKGLSDTQYAEAATGGPSIGAHYRHSLEHFQILLEAVKDGQVDYDRRARDARLETERLVALQATCDFREAARFLSTLSPDRPIEVSSKISYAMPMSYCASSTLGREIMFAVSHAIHHHALIAMICGPRKIAAARGFRCRAFHHRISERAEYRAQVRMSMLDVTWAKVFSLFFLTFFSEDAATLGGAAMAAAGLLATPLGLAACFLGIWLGDLGLYALARYFGRPFLKQQLGAPPGQ